MLDMRYPESIIREALFHAEEEVRLTALAYYSDAYTDDESIMPLVIKVVEKYGRDSAFRVLRDAERLPQTEETLDWLLGELRRDYDLRDVRQDNYRFAVGLVVLAVPLDLVVQRSGEILKCPAFANELRPALQELVEIASWDWKTAWVAFTAFGEHVATTQEFTPNDHHRLHRLITTLGRFRDEGNEQILALLQRVYHGTNQPLMEWMDPWIVRLAGQFRLQEATPCIIERCYEDDDAVRDECPTALAQIGGNAVVRALAEAWWGSDEEFCQIAAEALGNIRTDFCAQQCLQFLAQEEDPETQLMMGHAVLQHFSFEGIELVRKLVLGDEDNLVPDQFDLRYKLIATATAMGASFAEYREWHKNALETNYGSYDYETMRIAENFRLNLSDGGNGQPR